MCERGEVPCLVVTPPDRPRGRGRRSGEAPVATAAAELGLAVHKTARVDDEDSRELVMGQGTDLAMVCAFGQLSLIHISEPTRRTPISYAVFCLKKKKK